MVSYTEGTEVSVSDPTEWSALAPVPGWVIEVYMEESSHPTLSQTWAAFYMVGVDTETDGSHLLSVKFLGAEDEALSQTLAGQFFRGGRIHLCLSRPCVEVRPMDALHVTRIKFWSWDTFKDSADYLIAGISRSVTRWRKEIEAKPLEDPRGTAAPKKTPGKPKDAKDKGRAKPDTTAVGSGLSQEMKDRLKGKLSDIKKRVRGTAGAVHSSPPAELDGIPVEESEEDEVDYVPTSPEGDAAITTGTALVPHGKVLDKPEHRKAKRTKKDVDTKDIGSKSLSTQLIMRAVEATKLRKKQAKRKKSKKGKETRVVRLLSKILTGKSSGKEKAEKRGKKRRTMKDGVIRSCSSSSSDGETCRDQPEPRVRGGLRGPNEEEKPRSTGECAGNVNRAHQDGYGAIGNSGYPSGRCGSHDRNKGGQLFLDAHQAPLSSISEGAEGDALAISNFGFVEDGGRCESGRQSLSSLHGSSPVDDRPELVDGSPYGVAQHGRNIGSVGGDDSCIAKTFPVGRQGARKRVELQLLGRQRKRTRKNRLEGPTRRLQGRKRKRKEREKGPLWEVAKLRKLGQESKRMGEEQGEAGREGVRLSTKAFPSKTNLQSDSAYLNFSAVLRRCTTIQRAGGALA